MAGVDLNALSVSLEDYENKSQMTNKKQDFADGKQPTAQQLAQAPEAQEAAKPLAENKATSEEADNSKKTAQPTRVAAAPSTDHRTIG